VKESPQLELDWPLGVSTGVLALWGVHLMLVRAQLEGEKLVHSDAQSGVTTRATGSAWGVTCGVACGVGCGSAKDAKRESADKSDRKDMFGDDFWITRDWG
jgi:hypothetical protein